MSGRGGSTRQASPGRFGRVLGLGLLGLGLLTAACSSPEATRTRSGGPGGDVGNHGRTVDMHAQAPQGGMFYQTPRMGQAITK